MDVVKLIQSNRELKELPFLIVLRTLTVLDKIGVLKVSEEVKDVENA